MAKLVIIRGNSGSGKTTLAKELQLKWGHNSMLISQDIVRREILYVKDGYDTPVLPLIKELLIYGKNHCEITILEGILRYQWYKSVFDAAYTEFRDNIFAYYYDLSFEETLERHQSKNNRDDFGEREMRSWWNEKDLICSIPEKMITRDMSLIQTAEMICRDTEKLQRMR